jgi:hypothetical protein
MVDKISVQIALEGGDEVEKQLAAIGKAGDKAFAGLNEAGSTAADGITQAGDASQTTAEQTDKLTESSSKLSLETVKTSVEIAKATAGLTLHGVEIVQAVRHHDSLLRSLLKLVSGFNTATRVVAAFTPELALVGVTVGSTAAAVAAGAVAFEALEKVITKIAAGDEKLNNTLQTLAATSGKSFDELQRGEATFKQIGISAETFRGSIAKIQETLAGTEVTNLTKGMKDIVDLVKQIAAGDKTITFANWVTAEDKIKGVAIAMKQAQDTGKDATEVLLKFIRNADLASAIKIGAAFGLSEADVDRVRRLNENISDLTQRIKGAGPLISPEAAAAFDRMRTSIQNVDSAWERLKQSLGSTVFTSLAASFSATMNDMKAAAINAAASILESLGTAFSGMTTQATSDVTAIGAALLDLAQKTGALGLFRQMQADAQTANAAIATFVGSIMQGMGASAASIKAVQDSINGIAPAANAAGQAVQQSGVMFTQWGTVAQQGANTAQAAVQQTAVMFTSFGTVVSQSGDQAKASMEQAAGPAQSLSDKVAGLASKIAGIAWDAISGAGVAAWNALTAAIQSAIDKVLEFIGLKPSGPATGGGAPGKARGGFIGGRGSGTSDSNLAWLSRGEFVVQAAAVRKYGASLFAALNAQRFAGGGLVGGGGTDVVSGRGGIDQLVQAITTNTEAVKSQSDVIIRLGEIVGGLVQTVSGLAQTVSGLAQQQSQLVQSFNDLMRWAKRSAPGNARGGLLGGRGSGTSDSNLAWVSRGEHIMPARAVARPGVLAFLEALRRSGGNLSRVLDGMGRFALGGLVPRMPAFAAGGAVGSMSHVTIAFPGLPAIGGLRASSDVVDQLQRAAALAQVRSGGRKPSRYS